MTKTELQARGMTCHDTILPASSRRISELEAELSKENRKPGFLSQRSVRLCGDGRRRSLHLGLLANFTKDWFWKVAYKNQTTGCWEWLAYKTKEGYGGLRVSGEVREAHAVAAELVLGYRPKLVVCHTCRNPSCVNPSHLYLGTPADNVEDARRAGTLSRTPPCGEDSFHAKLKTADVVEIRRVSALGSVTFKSLATRYGVSETAVIRAARKLTWKHL